MKKLCLTNYIFVLTIVMPKSIKTHRNREKNPTQFSRSTIIANLFPSYFIYIMPIYYTHIL